MAGSTGFEEIGRRARILSPASYSLDGQTVQGASMYPPSRSIPPIVWQLQHHLYDQCYLGRTPRSGSFPSGVTDLSAVFASANPMSSRWDGGWVVEGIEPTGMFSVTRQGKSRMVQPGEFLSTEVGMPLRVGGPVNLFVPRESTGLQTGFYFAMGDTLGDQIEELAIVRFYLNLTADEAPAFLGQLTSMLCGYAIPFRLKVLSGREFYPRPDAMVLYVAERYSRVADRVCATAAELIDMTGRPVPLFTKRLADGLGAAEDPGNGESFGMSRCRVAAEGLWNAFVARVTAPDDVIAAIRRHAAGYGLDPERPYLNRPSHDSFAFSDDDV